MLHHHVDNGNDNVGNAAAATSALAKVVGIRQSAMPLWWWWSSLLLCRRRCCGQLLWLVGQLTDNE